MKIASFVLLKRNAQGLAIKFLACRVITNDGPETGNKENLRVHNIAHGGSPAVPAGD